MLSFKNIILTFSLCLSSLPVLTHAQLCQPQAFPGTEIEINELSTNPITPGIRLSVDQLTKSHVLIKIDNMPALFQGISIYALKGAKRLGTTNNYKGSYVEGTVIQAPFEPYLIPHNIVPTGSAAKYIATLDPNNSSITVPFDPAYPIYMPVIDGMQPEIYYNNSSVDGFNEFTVGLPDGSNDFYTYKGYEIYLLRSDNVKLRVLRIANGCGGFIQRSLSPLKITAWRAVPGGTAPEAVFPEAKGFIDYLDRNGPR